MPVWMLLQQYWARTANLYRYVPVREFAQAYRQSAAGEAQERALQREFKQCGTADSALTWTKHALTGDLLLLTNSLLGLFEVQHWGCSPPPRVQWPGQEA